MPNQTTFRLPFKGAGYESIKQTSEPIPQPQPHEVLLEIHAAALNYRDLAIASGQYPFSAKNDLVPLSDGAGIVVELGSAVKTIEKGDWAIVIFDLSNQYGPQRDRAQCLGSQIDGMLRQYIAVPASAIIKIPKTTSLTWPQLASLVCTGTTAWNALYGNNPLKPGQTVLFLGTGGVSMTGLLLAHTAGARTVITSSSDEKLELARSKYGADHTVNYKTTPKWEDEVNSITNGQGADIIFENGGAGTIAQSIKCVAKGGIVAVIGFLSQTENLPDVAALVLSKGCIVRGINVGSKQLTEDLVTLVTAKNLQLPIDKVFGFEKEEVLKAYECLKSGGHVGKICVQIK